MTKETAMKILKELHGKSLFAERTALETLIPELQESEDERIRKALIRFHKSTIDIDGIKGDRIVAWLEKQGEQKPTSDTRYEVKNGDSHRVVNGTPFDYELATITQNDFASVGETATIELSSPIDCGDRIYHVSHKPIEKNDEQKVSVADFKAKDWYVSKVDGKIRNIYYSVDKVEPKFKVGDWVASNICNSSDLLHIIDVDNKNYEVETQQGNTGVPSIVYIDNNFHLWSIQDAKDGDALVAPPVNGSEQIFIFKEIKDRKYVKNAVEYYCRVFNNEFCVNERGFMGQSDDYFTPATKEQRDLLFTKMKEAGYTFDFDKKELKKIEDEIEIPFGAKDSELQEATYYIPKGFHAEIDDDKVVIKKGEKSAAWSEEDENYLQSAENACEYQYGKNTSTILWLKRLKDRIGG